MPLVETSKTEEQLRGDIARLQQLIKRNPLTAGDQSKRLEVAKNELNALLLSKPGYSVIHESDIQARIEAAVKAAHEAATADVEARIEAAVKAAHVPEVPPAPSVAVNDAAPVAV